MTNKTTTHTTDLLPDYILGQMVSEYRETKDDFIFSEIMDNVGDMVRKQAYREWHKSSGLNLGKDEFVQVAYIGLMNAVNNYTSERGSNFVSFVTANVKWAINDNIYKKQTTKTEEFNRDSLSLDYSYGSDEGTFMDTIEHQLATDPNDVYESVIEEMDSDNTLINKLNKLVTEFSVINEADSTIVKSVIAIILEDAEATAKTVNAKLAAAFPEIKSATLRKRKSRAMSRFTEYAEENGFSIDLSQF